MNRDEKKICPEVRPRAGGRRAPLIRVGQGVRTPKGCGAVKDVHAIWIYVVIGRQVWAFPREHVDPC